MPVFYEPIYKSSTISSLVFLGSLCVLGASRGLSSGCPTVVCSSLLRLLLKKGFVSFSKPSKCTCHFHRPQWQIPPPSHTLQSTSEITGSPGSKYKHRRTSTLLHNIRNIRICMGKKTFLFRNLRKSKDFNNLDAVAVNETWLHDGYFDGEILTSSLYTIFRKDS